MNKNSIPTMAEIAKEADKIFNELFTAKDILKGNSIEMSKEAWDIAYLRLIPDDVTVINDRAMTQCMADDLEQNYNYTEIEANVWMEQHGENVVSNMWDAYTKYFEEYAIYKESEND